MAQIQQESLSTPAWARCINARQCSGKSTCLLGCTRTGTDPLFKICGDVSTSSPCTFYNRWKAYSGRSRLKAGALYTLRIIPVVRRETGRPVAKLELMPNGCSHAADAGQHPCSRPQLMGDFGRGHDWDRTFPTPQCIDLLDYVHSFTCCNWSEKRRLKVLLACQRTGLSVAKALFHSRLCLGHACTCSSIICLLFAT